MRVVPNLPTSREAVCAQCLLPPSALGDFPSCGGRGGAIWKSGGNFRTHTLTPARHKVLQLSLSVSLGNLYGNGFSCATPSILDKIHLLYHMQLGEVTLGNSFSLQALYCSVAFYVPITLLFTFGISVTCSVTWFLLVSGQYCSPVCADGASRIISVKELIGSSSVAVSKISSSVSVKNG